MEIEYQRTSTLHRLVITATRETISGDWMCLDRTPTIEYASKRYAYLCGRVVAINSVGIKCGGRDCTVTLVGNTYCTKCAEILHSRRKEAEVFKETSKQHKVSKETPLAALMAMLTSDEKKEMVSLLRKGM